MSSVFRKGGKISVEYEISLSWLIHKETRRVARSLDCLDTKAREAEYQRFIIDDIGGDPSYISRERALASILRALADGDIRAFLTDDDSKAIFAINPEAWFAEASWRDPDDKGHNEAWTIRLYRSGLLRGVWPPASCGADKSEPFYSKRVGSKVVVDREEAIRWLRRFSNRDVRQSRPSSVRLRKIFPRLSPAARRSSVKNLHQLLKRAGITRKSIEALDRQDRPARGRKPK